VDSSELDRPLNEDDELWRFEKQNTYIIDNIRADDFIEKMYSSECITSIHRKQLLSTPNDSLKCGHLLNVLRRRSFGQFRRFLEYLQETDLAFVSRALQENSCE